MNIERATTLYKFLVREFGVDKCASLYGETVSDEFVEFVAEFTDGELRQGLQTMREQADAWPPNNSQFRGWCKQAKPAKPQEFPKALPSPDKVTRNLSALCARHAGDIPKFESQPDGRYDPHWQARMRRHLRETTKKLAPKIREAL